MTSVTNIGPCKFQDLKTMIENVADFEPSNEDIYWFINYLEAMMILDQWSTKDIASALMDGGIMGYTSEEDVDLWLENHWHLYNEDDDDHYMELNDLVHEFFNDMNRQG